MYDSISSPLILISGFGILLVNGLNLKPYPHKITAVTFLLIFLRLIFLLNFII